MAFGKVQTADPLGLRVFRPDAFQFLDTTRARYTLTRRHVPSQHFEREGIGVVSGSRHGIAATKECRNVMIT